MLFTNSSVRVTVAETAGKGGGQRVPPELFIMEISNPEYSSSENQIATDYPLLNVLCHDMEKQIRERNRVLSHPYTAVAVHA